MRCFLTLTQQPACSSSLPSRQRHAKDAYALLKKATRAEAHVILVGDVRQLSSVEAGHPFRSLQQAGLQTAHLEESLRQRTPDLKSAVDAVARGEVKAGLERLEQFDRVVEIPTTCKLFGDERFCIVGEGN